MHAAAAAPDHGRVRPSRFIALRGANKDAFGEVLERGYRHRCQQVGVEPDDRAAQKERTKLGRAPLVIVAATVRPAPGSRETSEVNLRRAPWEERRLSTAASVQNILLAATSLGYGSMWRSGDVIDDPVVKEALGLAPDDDIIGFVYLGTPAEEAALPPNEPRGDGLLTEWIPR